jgi:hypothetical protein
MLSLHSFRPPCFGSRFACNQDHSFDIFYEPVLWAMAMQRAGLAEWHGGIMVMIYPIALCAHYLNPETIRAGCANDESAAARAASSGGSNVAAISPAPVKQANRPLTYNVEAPLLIFCDEDLMFLLTCSLVLPAAWSLVIVAILSIAALASAVGDFIGDGCEWARRCNMLLIPVVYINLAWYDVLCCMRICHL